MLTQTEAAQLIAMRKRFVSSNAIRIGPGTDETHELLAEDERERFLLDVRQGTIRLSKVTLQNRARTVYVLVRVDVNSSPHTNPDGTRIGPSHIHVYREGFESKWACPLDPREFTDAMDTVRLLRDFCRRCNIVGVPNVQKVLL